MMERILLSGTGGQGVQVIAKMLAEAIAEEEKYELIYTALYSGVQRGGDSTANLIVSDKPIGAPMIIPGEITALLAMSNAALATYESYLAPGALLLLDRSMVTDAPSRSDVQVETVDTGAIIREAGNPRAANLAALGALLKHKPVASPEKILQTIEATFAGKPPQVIESNQKALLLGMQ